MQNLANIVPNIIDFWATAPCSLVFVDCVSQALTAIIALMTEAGSISETSVNSYQITRCSIPEDNRLHTCQHEILKSHPHSSSSVSEISSPGHPLAPTIFPSAISAALLVVHLHTPRILLQNLTCTVSICCQAS
jgi:hypothetical protein